MIFMASTTLRTPPGALVVSGAQHLLLRRAARNVDWRGPLACRVQGPRGRSVVVVDEVLKHVRPGVAGANGEDLAKLPTNRTVVAVKSP